MSVVRDIFRQRRPPPPVSRRVSLTVHGPAPETIAATLAPDNGSILSAVRDERHFTFVVPGSVTGGAWIHLLARDYEPVSFRIVLPLTDTELDAVTLARARPPAREGIVGLDRRVLVDAGGRFLGLGASLFWAGWGYIHDRPRLEENLQFLARHGVDYIRVLGVVGPAGLWEDRTVAEADLIAHEVAGGLTDLAYSHGLRVEWTIFGGQDNLPSHQDRDRVVRRFIDQTRGREHAVIHWEIANEGYATGWDDQKDEIKRLADLVRDQTPHIVATSAPDVVQAGSDRALDFPGWYGGSKANLATVHLDRSPGDRGWRHVRQARDPMLFWSGAWSSNEPIGPQSSVASDDDPLRLTMAAAYTWLCNGAAWVLHTGAGVRGGGAADLARGRSSNLWEVPRVEETLAGLATVRKLLPPELPNWAFQNNNRQAGPRHPFNTDRLVPLVEGGQLLRAFAAIAGDGRFVMAPILADVPVPFEARYAMHVDVHDPMTGELSEAHDLASGQTWTMAPRLAAVVIGRSA